MKILASEKKADVQIILLRDKKLPTNLSKTEKEALKIHNFEGEGCCFLSESKTCFVGLEKYNYEFPNALSDALANAIQSLKKLKIKSISIEIEKKEEIQKVCLGILLGMYSYDAFKSVKSKTNLSEVYLVSKKIDRTTLQNGILESTILAQSINNVRDLVNTPPQQATPKLLQNMWQIMQKSWQKKAVLSVKFMIKSF